MYSSNYIKEAIDFLDSNIYRLDIPKKYISSYYFEEEIIKFSHFYFYKYDYFNNLGISYEDHEYINNEFERFLDKKSKIKKILNKVSSFLYDASNKNIDEIPSVLFKHFDLDNKKLIEYIIEKLGNYNIAKIEDNVLIFNDFVKNQFSDNKNTFKQSESAIEIEDSIDLYIDNIIQNIEYFSIESFFNNNKDFYEKENGQLIIDMISGKTLKAVSDQYDFSYTEIKDILKSFFKNENKFPEYYLKYFVGPLENWTKKELISVLDLSEISLKYLELVDKYTTLPPKYNCKNEEKSLEFVNAVKKKFNMRVDFYDCSIIDYIEFIYKNQKEEKTKINYFIEKLKGETLESIGSKNNITRERVRQIISKVLEKIPPLKENQYFYLIEEYNVPYEIFNNITGLTIYSYNYINLVTNKQKNQKNLLEILNLTDDNFRNEYLRNNNLIIIDDKLVSLTKKNIIDYLIQKINSKVHISEFVNLLKKDFHNLYENWDDERLINHSVSSILERSMKSLSSLNFNYRYYDINSFLNNEEWVNKMKNILDINEGCYSSNYFFKKHNDFMNEIDIKSEYELHNLLKKISIETKLFSNIEFSRMPTMLFGKTNRKDFLVKILNTLTPIKIEDFATYLENNYGFNKVSMIANLPNELSEYLISDLLAIDLKLDESLLLKITNIFNNKEEIVLSKNDVLNIFDKNSIPEYCFNSIYFKDTKYNVGISYIIDKNWTIEKLKWDILNKKRSFDNDLISYLDRATTTLFYEELLNFEVIEIEPQKIILFEDFYKNTGIDKDQILHLNNEIEKFLNIARILSYENVVSLLKPKCEILRSNIDIFTLKKMISRSTKILLYEKSKLIFFLNKKDNVDFKEWMKNIINNQPDISIENLVAVINKRFLFNIDSPTLLKIISEFDGIYFDKEKNCIKSI